MLPTLHLVKQLFKFPIRIRTRWKISGSGKKTGSVPTYLQFCNPKGTYVGTRYWCLYVGTYLPVCIPFYCNKKNLFWTDLFRFCVHNFFARYVPILHHFCRRIPFRANCLLWSSSALIRISRDLCVCTGDEHQEQGGEEVHLQLPGGHGPGQRAHRPGARGAARWEGITVIDWFACPPPIQGVLWNLRLPSPPGSVSILRIRIL